MGGRMERHATAFSGWRMVAIAFLIINVALGVNFAAYGALVGAIETEYGTTRAMAAGGLSMLTLALGLLSPIAGMLMQKLPLRLLMTIGVLMNAAGYALIAQSRDIHVLLGSFVLLIGPGFCLFAIIPCTAIIGNWFVAGRGKALGIANMPIGNAVMPLVAAYVLSHHGLTHAFMVNVVLLLALLPLILLLVDRPERIGQHAQGVGMADGKGPATHARPPLSATEILKRPSFYMVTLGVGTISAGGMTMMTHLVAMGTGRGLDIASASLLLSIFGLAGLVGAPGTGWIADRIGGRYAFILLAAIQVPAWLGLLVVGASLPVLLVLAALIGACCNGVMTLFGATLGEWLGGENVGLGMGLCYLLQIPFLFGAGPLAGAMFDATGSYHATIVLHAGSFVLIALLFLAYHPAWMRRR